VGGGGAWGWGKEEMISYVLPQYHRKIRVTALEISLKALEISLKALKSE
jgi:hypothetical protein